MSAKISTAQQLAEKMIDVAKNYNTLYVMGCFGAPMNDANKERYIKHCAHYNGLPERSQMIKSATANTFGFDCVCLIKGLLWGWCGDENHIYGGATYCSNDVPDIDEDYMINLCENVSTDFSKIEVGEAVWMQGHIGVYVGDGLAVECTPKWENKVQITACNCTKAGYNRRDWVKHGKLPYVSYEQKQSIAQIAKETARELRIKIENAGYNYFDVKDEVKEEMCKAIEQEGEIKPYLVKIAFHIREIPSNEGKIIKTMTEKELSSVYTIVEEQNGWGLLKAYSENRNGWINLDFVEKYVN